MAIKIPQYDENKQVIDRGQVAPRNLPEPIELTKPSPDAFGVGAAEAKGNMFKGLERLGNATVDVAIQAQDADNKQKVIDASNGYLKEQQALLDDEKDGLLNKELNNAKGITASYDKKSAELKAKYLDALDNPTQKKVLNNQIDSYILSTKDTVMRHENNEDRRSKQVTFETNQKASIDHSRNIIDVPSLKNFMGTSLATSTAAMASMGYDTDTINLKNGEYAGKMVEASVSTLLAQGKVGEARALLLDPAINGTMDQESVAKINQTIKGKEIYDVKDKVVAEARKFRMITGDTDMGKVKQLVEAIPGFTNEEKEKIFDGAKSDISQEDSNIKDRRIASKENYLNWAVKQNQKGTPIANITAEAIHYGYDEHSVHLLQEAAKDLILSPTVHEDPKRYLELEQMADSKTLKAEEADKALADKEITPAHYIEIIKKINKGTSLDIAGAYKEADDMIDAKFNAKKKIKVDGVSRNARDVMKVILRDNTKGKNAGQILEYAKGITKNEVGVTVDGVWKETSAKKAIAIREDVIAKTSKYIETVGQKPFSLIGNDADAVKFIDDNGGLEAFTYGMPKYNALQSLAKNGIRPTKKYIDFILTKYPNGEVPGKIFK